MSEDSTSAVCAMPAHIMSMGKFSDYTPWWDDGTRNLKPVIFVCKANDRVVIVDLQDPSVMEKLLSVTFDFKRYIERRLGGEIDKTDVVHGIDATTVYVSLKTKVIK